ncbi:PIGK1 [Auxenochlorella protothecoides x Auxenochlorella symbiontica]
MRATPLLHARRSYVSGRIARVIAVLLGLACRCWALKRQPAHPPHAIILSASRGWLNYRHTLNALEVYRSARGLGMPDRRIRLLLADPLSCNPRNARYGQLHAAGPRGEVSALHPAISARGEDVSEAALLQLLSGVHPPGTPASQRLLSTGKSNVVVFLTGHGGDQFLKMHDRSEFLEADLAAAIRAMHALGRYAHLLILIDTCQAATLCSTLSFPNVICITSSVLGQSSYAKSADSLLGLHVVDEFSHAMGQRLGEPGAASKTLHDLLANLQSDVKLSTVSSMSTGGDALMKNLTVGDFFA